MKELRLSFEDKEFKKIKKVKDLSGDNWKNFILNLIKYSEMENKR